MSKSSILMVLPLLLLISSCAREVHHSTVQSSPSADRPVGFHATLTWIDSPLLDLKSPAGATVRAAADIWALSFVKYDLNESTFPGIDVGLSKMERGAIDSNIETFRESQPDPYAGGVLRRKVLLAEWGPGDTLVTVVCQIRSGYVVRGADDTYIRYDPELLSILTGRDGKPTRSRSFAGPLNLPATSPFSGWSIGALSRNGILRDMTEAGSEWEALQAECQALDQKYPKAPLEPLRPVGRPFPGWPMAND